MSLFTIDPHPLIRINSSFATTPNEQTTVDDFTATRHRCGMMIYKIFRSDEWWALQNQGDTAGAPIDLADGYIHFSTASQAQETADKHFVGIEGLYLAAVDIEAVDNGLVWEVSRGGAKFPHLFARLRISDIVWCLPLPLVEGRHQFPNQMV